MFGNTWSSIWFSLFSIFASDFLLEFHDLIWFVALKYLMYFLAGINTEWIWNVPKEKYFAPLRILKCIY